ncbi:MAG: tetratricopeptide repeat protein [Verrucomicrobiota bacterium]|jgi:Flp pilus assembly protein TadD
MKPLEPPDSHYLAAAEGWLGLKNWREAGEELRRIDPALSEHPAVLLVQYEIHAAASQWALAAETAATLAETAPDEPGAWTALAYATRRKPGGGIPPAKEILAAAQRRFPSEPLIAYNLACYECQLGNLAQARTWLGKAFELGDSTRLKRQSLQDPDLGPLHDEIEGM